jgi:hypothetical protein
MQSIAKLKQRFLRLVSWARKNKLLLTAGALTAAEAMVQLGVPLPGAELIPAKWRGFVIGLLMSGAFVFRILAARKEK